MKISAMELNNFANYEKVSVSFDENVTYLVGRNGSGKSTIGITGVQAILQGIAEKATQGTQPVIGERFRFIGGNGATSTNQMKLIDEKNGNAEIVITRKITKTGSELKITAPESYGQLDQAWLNNLFNLYMISPKSFTELSGAQQARAIGIDTATYDKDISDLKEAAKTIRIELKQYEKLTEVEKAESVDVSSLQAQRQEEQQRLNTLYQQNKNLNNEARNAYNALLKKEDERVAAENARIEESAKHLQSLKTAKSRIETLLMEFEIEELVDYNSLTVAIDNYPKPKEKEHPKYPEEPTYIPELPDNSLLLEIEQKIVDAGETNKKALLYTQYTQSLQAKNKKQAELNKNIADQKTKENDRVKYIQSLKLPFSNLTVNEDGELLLKDKTGQHKPIREPYFSTGEILKIVPILIAHQQPELKYVFVQGYRDLDEENWKQVEDTLVGKGFQLVVEVVGKEKLSAKNCILLKDNVVVEDYSEDIAPIL